MEVTKKQKNVKRIFASRIIKNGWFAKILGNVQGNMEVSLGKCWKTLTIIILVIVGLIITISNIIRCIRSYLLYKSQVKPMVGGAEKVMMFPKITICLNSIHSKVGNLHLFYSVKMNILQNSKFYVKTKFWLKDKIFGQKQKFWSKVPILVDKRNFRQKSKFWSEIEILVDKRNFRQKSKFWSIMKFLSKVEFSSKVEFWSEIEILVDNGIFGQKSKLWPKIEGKYPFLKYKIEQKYPNQAPLLLKYLDYYYGRHIGKFLGSKS